MKRLDFKYYVIQFLELPYDDINEYVCIPWSWIRLKRSTDRKVVVSYPVEDPSDTEKRVKRRQRYSEGWNLYMCVVKYRTDVYEEAQFFINEQIYEGKTSNIKNEGDKEREKKSHRPKATYKVDTPQTLSKDEDTSAIKIKIKRKPSTNPSTEVAEPRQESTNKDILTQKSSTQEKSNKENSIEKTAPPETNTQNRASDNKDSSEQENRKRSEQEYFTNYLMLKKCTKEKSNNENCTEKTAPPETSTQNRESVNKDSSDQQNQNRSEQEYFTEYLMLLSKLHVSFADMHSMFDQLREAFIHNSETIVKLIKTVENSRGLSNNAPNASSSNNPIAEVTKASEGKQNEENEQINDDGDDGDNNHYYAPNASSSNNPIAEVTKASEGKQHEENEQINDDDGDNSDDEYYDDDVDFDSYDEKDDCIEETPNKKRRYYMRRFVPPPYWYMCTREWTLKHDEPARGLVELMPGTMVYVDAENLEHCKILSNDCETLARMLLIEIFNERALRVCTLTGDEFPNSGYRPALQKHARKVLLTFVQEYGREKGWTILDTKSLMESLRNKLKAMRPHRNYFNQDC